MIILFSPRSIRSSLGLRVPVTSVCGKQLPPKRNFLLPFLLFLRNRRFLSSASVSSPPQPSPPRPRDILNHAMSLCGCSDRYYEQLSRKHCRMKHKFKNAVLLATPVDCGRPADVDFPPPQFSSEVQYNMSNYKYARLEVGQAGLQRKTGFFAATSNDVVI
jgi:hypothetical protein